MSLSVRRSLRFADLTIEYDDRVLQPRPWTELQSRWAAELLTDAPGGPLLELCSGAGHIGLGAAALSGRPLVCVDLDPAACYFTRLNAEGAGLDHRVEVREGPLERVLVDQERFALVLADPPWVTSDAIGALPGDPRLAIDGGPDGLEVARACLRASRGHLPSGGPLLLQLGTDDQADRVTGDAVADGWREQGRRGAAPTAGSGGGVVLHLAHP